MISYSFGSRKRAKTRTEAWISFSCGVRLRSSACCFFTFNNPRSTMKAFRARRSASRLLYTSSMRSLSCLSKSVSVSRNSISARGSSASMSYSGSNSSRFTLKPVSSATLPACRSSPGRAKDAKAAVADGSSSSRSSSPPSSSSPMFFEASFARAPAAFASFSSTSATRSCDFPRTLLMSGSGAVGERTYTSK